MADGSDGLYEECVGPSAYWKAQGTMIRVWGLLVSGFLFVTILPEGVVMNRWWYAWIVEKKFPIWLEGAGVAAGRAFLLQDHERSLWTEEAKASMRSIGITLLERYPKCSQDLNPIETAWRELRDRLASTQPKAMETRTQFAQRLRNAVTWLNTNRSEYFAKLCSSQKAWANDVLKAKGARTKH